MMRQGRELHRTLWADFCERHEVGLPKDVPLFAREAGGAVQVTSAGKRRVLVRHPDMEDLVLREVKRAVDDFRSGTEFFDGVLYLMYRRAPSGDCVPLYVGKAEKFGKGDRRSLSANLKGKSGPSNDKFARWGYGRAYHIGDLSAALFEDGPKPAKYRDWADALFADRARRMLRWDVFFWMKAWQSSVDAGPWLEFGPCSLTFAEYQAIGVASSAYPDDILNREGVSRS